MAVDANAIPKIEAWILAQLTGDSALTALVSTRVFKDFAPVTTVFPFVVFSMRPRQLLPTRCRRLPVTDAG